jgi:hypothetical protein
LDVSRRATTSTGKAQLGRKRADALRKLSGIEREILAFLIAPLVPALLLILPAVFHDDSIAFAQFLAYSTVSYCATLLIAVPAHFLLRKRHWTLLSLYVSVGGAMGLAVFLFHFMLGVPARTPGFGPVARTLISLPVDMMGGVLILTCFWLIARPDRERPDGE